MTTNETLHSAVRDAYGARAREVLAGTPGSRSAGVASTLYGEAASLMPESLVSYGCGNPVAIAGLQIGETVLDLGSGAGLDCFLSARQVGPSGRVIGVDMTDDMLALAERNRAQLGIANVEFRKGLIEEIPVDDTSVDLVISNCVINLSPDKDAVFRESLRVLRPGGRFQVSDIVLLREITDAERADLDLWSACKSGALLREDYIARLQAAGFEDVEVVVGHDAGSDAWTSALINARRPGGAQAGAPWRLPNGQPLELIPMAAAASCCGPECCAE